MGAVTDALVSVAAGATVEAWALSAMPPAPYDLAAVQALRTAHAAAPWPLPLASGQGVPDAQGSAQGGLVWYHPAAQTRYIEIGALALVTPGPAPVLLFALPLPGGLYTYIPTDSVTVQLVVTASAGK